MDLVLTEQRGIGTIYFLMSEDERRDAAEAAVDRRSARTPRGPDPDSAKGFTHPRAYGSYPRMLGKYVREEHVLTLEDAIRKMSGAVAERLLIPDRGLLREGMYADVVVFDPATILEQSTYERPNQLSTGVREVFVNGVEVVRDGVHTGAKPGRVVRGPGWHETGAAAK